MNRSEKAFSRPNAPRTSKVIYFQSVRLKRGWSRATSASLLPESASATSFCL